MFIKYLYLEQKNIFFIKQKSLGPSFLLELEYFSLNSSSALSFSLQFSYAI